MTMNRAQRRRAARGAHPAARAEAELAAELARAVLLWRRASIGDGLTEVELVEMRRLMLGVVAPRVHLMPATDELRCALERALPKLARDDWRAQLGVRELAEDE